MLLHDLLSCQRQQEESADRAGVKVLTASARSSRPLAADKAGTPGTDVQTRPEVDRRTRPAAVQAAIPDERRPQTSTTLPDPPSAIPDLHPPICKALICKACPG